MAENNKNELEILTQDYKNLQAEYRQIKSANEMLERKLAGNELIVPSGRAGMN